MNENQKQIEMSLEDKIREFGGDQSVEENLKTVGVETTEDLSMLSDTELVEAGFTLIQARKLRNSLSTVQTQQAIMVQNDHVLPAIPDEENWLKDLKVGGVLNIDQSAVIAAVKVALAYQTGIFDLPKRIVDAMEKQAETLDKPVSKKFYELRAQIIRRNYGDLFSAISGAEASFVASKTRKTQLLSKVNDYMWPAILRSRDVLSDWYESWRSQIVDPAMLMVIMSGAATNTQIPVAATDIGLLQDAAAELKDDLNKVFSGCGLQTSAALAYEAKQIVESFNDDDLPNLVGAQNREHMLKMFFDIPVSADYVRLEKNLSQYVVGFLNLDKIDNEEGEDAVRYASALWQLSRTIAWDKLQAQDKIVKTKSENKSSDDYEESEEEEEDEEEAELRELKETIALRNLRGEVV